MARVKRVKTANKRRKRTLKAAKGFMWSRKTKFRAAKEALQHARVHMFTGRKLKKRNFRRLWQIQIGAAAKENGLSYSRLIDNLKKSNIALDRKVLSEIAENHPETFKAVIEAASKRA